MSRGCVRAVLAALCAAGWAQAAGALTIDDFEEGPFVLAHDFYTDGEVPNRSEQADLDPSHVVGGVRLAVARALLGSTRLAAAAGVPLPGLDDGLLVSSDADGHCLLIYDGLAGGEVSAGSAGALALDLRSFDEIAVEVAAVTGPITVELWLWDSTGHQKASMPLSEGTNRFALAPFSGVDRGDIRQIAVTLTKIRDASARVTDISALRLPSSGSGLPAPELLAPAHGGHAASQAPAFSWTAVAGATGYRLSVAEDPDLLSDDPGAPACGACSLDVATAGPAYTHEAGLPASTVHGWRVQALPAGDWSEASLFTTSGSMAIQITRPESDAFLDTGSVVVRGAMTPPPGTEIGIEVNGIPAFHDSAQFGAVIPLADSVDAIVATARNAAGGVLGRHAIPVSVDLSAQEPVVTFSAAPTMGTAPHTAYYTFTTREFVWALSLDADSNGDPERVGRAAMDAHNEPSYTYDDPGFYEPTLTVVTDEGTATSVPQTHVLSELVRVYSVEELDAILKPRWSALKDAIRAGNVSAALEHVVIDKRSHMRTC